MQPSDANVDERIEETWWENMRAHFESGSDSTGSVFRSTRARIVGRSESEETWREKIM